MTDITEDDNEEIGIEDIAELLNVSRGTVQLWNSRVRAILPPPDRRVSNIPLWRKSTIVAWAKSTGRWGKRRVNRFDVPTKTGAA